MHRSTLRSLLLLAGALLCAGLLTACGDARGTTADAAATTLDETLAATSKLDSARLTGRFELDPDGLLALGGPIVLSASGPIAAPAAGKGPRFDLAAVAALAGRSFTVRASSTGEQAFLRLDGRDYALGATGGATGDGASKRSSAESRQGALASLGLDPASWIKDPKTKGNATIAGVDTIRIAGKLDVGKLLADVAKLLDGGTPAAGLLTPKLRRQITDAVKSATIEVATGAQDKILRQLTGAVDFTFDKGSPRPISGLDGGKINLRLSLADVNATSFAVAAPKRARPLSQLLGDGGLGSLRRGLGASFGGSEAAGDGGAAFLRCVTAAGARTAEVMRCASKLAP